VRAVVLGDLPAGALGQDLDEDDGERQLCGVVDGRGEQAAQCA
jgi:hypothetical protein